MEKKSAESVPENIGRSMAWWIKTCQVENDFSPVETHLDLTNQEKLCIAEGVIVKAIVERDLLAEFEWSMYFEKTFYQAVQCLREQPQSGVVAKVIQYADFHLYDGTLPVGVRDSVEDPLAKKLSVGAATLFRFVQEIVSETKVPQSKLKNASIEALIGIAQGGIKNNPALKAPQVCPYSGKVYYDKAWLGTFLKLHTTWGWKLAMGETVKPQTEIEGVVGCPALWAGVFSELVEKVFLHQPRLGPNGAEIN